MQLPHHNIGLLLAQALITGRVMSAHRGPSTTPRDNRTPHQGKREMARRVRQMAKAA